MKAKKKKSTKDVNELAASIVGFATGDKKKTSSGKSQRGPKK